MLSALVENCGPRFQTTFADAQLVERIKIMSQDPLVDASVRKKLMRMLLSWNYQFKGESTMRIVSGLYSACGGGLKSDAQLKSEAAEAYRKRKELDDRDRQLRIDQKAAERLQREEDQKQAKERKKGGNKRPLFDFQKVRIIIVSFVLHILTTSYHRKSQSFCLLLLLLNKLLLPSSTLCNM